MTARGHLSLLRDIGVTGGARVYSTLVSLAALMLTARWLGPEGRGVVVVVTTWVTLFANLGHLCLGQVCVHRAASEPDMAWIGPAVGALAAVAAAATAVGWTAAALVYAVAGQSLFAGIPFAALALGFAALPFLIWEQYGSVLLSIVGRLRTYNVNQIVGRTAGLLLLIVAIKLLGLGIYGFLLAFVVAQALVATAGAAVLLRHARGRLKGGLAAVGGLVRDGLKIHLVAVGMLLVSGVDIVMLQYFRGPAETGIFQLPMQLFLALLLVPQAAQLALQSRVASRSPAEFWREHRVILAIVLGAMTVIGAVLWLAASPVVRLLGGSEFAASAPVLQVLVFGLPAAALSTLMAIQWLTRGFFWQASLLTLALGAIICGLNLLLIPRFGATGAALAFVIGYAAVPIPANVALAISISRSARDALATNSKFTKEKP